MEFAAPAIQFSGVEEELATLAEEFEDPRGLQAAGEEGSATIPARCTVKIQPMAVAKAT